MKQTAIMDRIQREMRPGVIVRDGFLGDDARKLAEILEDDDAAVRRLGLSHGQIAARMRELTEAGKEGLGQDIAVGEHWEVRVDSVRGALPCPFGHKGLYPKLNTTVTHRRLNRSVTYTDLNTHMIEAHGFYEGRHAPFRQDPATLAQLLEITPEGG